LRDVLPLLGHPVGPDEDLDALFVGYLAAYEKAWSGYDDVHPAVRALHEAGVVTAVLTNGTEQQQRAKLARLDLLDTIGPVFTAEGLGVTKPNPRAFLAVCTQLRLEPAQVLYVGDEHPVDVLGARAAGLHAVLVDRLGTGPAAEPHRITTLAGLTRFLPGGAPLDGPADRPQYRA
jgi:putative hydrolase of the HAD superfamily